MGRQQRMNAIWVQIRNGVVSIEHENDVRDAVREI